MSAQIGPWQECDKMGIGALKLTGTARMFYNGCLQPNTEEVTWDSFKSALSQRFKDAHSNQFHFMQLQTARQRKKESPRVFVDRCKGLAQKVMRKVDDPVAQRIHRENANRMLLCSIVAGLGEIRKQVHCASPRNINRRCQ